MLIPRPLCFVHLCGQSIRGNSICGHSSGFLSRDDVYMTSAGGGQKSMYMALTIHEVECYSRRFGVWSDGTCLSAVFIVHKVGNLTRSGSTF